MTNSTPLLDLQNKLVSEFKDFEATANGSAASALFSMRRKAIDVFNTLGFPTTKNEEWKYTNLEKFVNGDGGQQAPAPQTITDPTYTIPGIENAHQLVFVDGKYDENLSKPIIGDQGITILTFSQAMATHPALVAEYFGKSLNADVNGMVALNTAFAMDGAFILVPQGAKPAHPVQIIYLSGGMDPKPMHQFRNLIIVEEGASLELIESYVSAGANASFSNFVSEIYVGQNAILNHYRFQDEDIENARQVNFTQVTQQLYSLVNNFTITTGGKLVRNDLQYKMADKNCESHMFGLYILDGTQHVDNHTLMDHAMPNCFSNEFYKGIMGGKSTGVFNGKIIVRPDAQKTNAYQSNKNVLLSDEAHINTKPQLEIFANDVKCSHGATTGQLDDEALFYLRSRGIGINDAKAILTGAFAAEVIGNIGSEPLKEYAKGLIENKLSQIGK